MEIITKYLRPRKAALLNERYRLYNRPAEARITEVNNGGIIAAYTDIHGDVISGVIDSDGNFITDSHEVDFPHEVEQTAKNLDFTFKDETIVYLGLFNSHWGHFITDCLANFWCLDSFSDLKLVFSYYEGQKPKLHDNILSALELLGVRNRIEFVSEPRRYRRIIVPRKGMVPRGHVLNECATVYETLISRALEKVGTPDTFHKKIILSRQLFPKAVLNDLGTKEVEQVFIDNGYHIVYPEKLSLVELIACLSNADDVVTISGTPAHNMLFAPPGSALTIIEKYANINNYQQGIDQLKQLKVTYIDAGFFIHSVSPGLGPFIMGDTPEFRQFANDNRLTYNLSNENRRRTLARYFDLYYRHYKRQWIMPEWLEPEIGLLREAYIASQPVFGQWLDGTKNIFLTDALRPRTLAKRLLRFLRQ